MAALGGGSDGFLGSEPGLTRVHWATRNFDYDSDVMKIVLGSLQLLPTATTLQQLP